MSFTFGSAIEAVRERTTVVQLTVDPFPLRKER
jgi:hypothetical protein